MYPEERPHRSRESKYDNTQFWIGDLVAKEPWVDVRAYGARIDGITDNSTPFQKAYDALPTNGGSILLPYGDYYVSTAITGTKAGVKIIGQGYPRYPTGGDSAVRIKTDQAIYIFDLGSASATNHGGPQFENISFQDSSGAGTASGALRIKRMNHVRLVNCAFGDFETGYGLNLDGTGDACIVPSLIDCKSRNTKYPFKGVLTSKVNVIGGFYNATGISGAIGFEGPELDLTNVALDGWPTGVKVTGNLARIALSRFEDNDLSIHLNSGARHQVIGNVIVGGDGDETGVQIDNGVTAFVLMGNIYSNLATDITNNAAATAGGMIFDLVSPPSTNKHVQAEAGEDLTYTLHNYRQAYDEHTKFLAEAGRAAVKSKIEAHFSATQGGAWVGAESDHSTYLLANNAPIAEIKKAAGIFPATDDTYWLGSIWTPYPAWKGIVLKDTTDGKHYKITSVNGVLTVAALD